MQLKNAMKQKIYTSLYDYVISAVDDILTKRIQAVPTPMEEVCGTAKETELKKPSFGHFFMRVSGSVYELFSRPS